MKEHRECEKGCQLTNSRRILRRSIHKVFPGIDAAKTAWAVLRNGMIRSKALMHDGTPPADHEKLDWLFMKA